MDTNGMDTNALVAVGADAVLSVATRHGRMTTVGSAGENPSSGLFRPAVVRQTTVDTAADVYLFAAR